MSLKTYIRGERKGKDVNRLEKEAMRDKFLAEAMEGYDTAKGDQTRRIEAMQQRIRQRTRRRRTALYWNIAASILLLLGLGGGGYFLMNRQPSLEKNLARNETAPEEAVAVAAFDTVADGMDETVQEEAEMQAEIPAEIRIRALPEPVPAIAAEEKAAVEMKMEDTEIRAASLPEAEKDADAPIAMESSQDALNEVVVTAFGHSKKERTVSAAKRTVPEDSIPLGEPVAGIGHLNEYVEQNRKILKDGCSDVHGTVRLSFRVDSKGKPVKIRVIKSLCPASDREAVRLLKKSPAWKPADGQVAAEIKM